MRISIDAERCEGHGMCVLNAPAVFTLDDDGLAQFVVDGDDLPESVAVQARFAVGTCPVAALREE